MRRRVFANGLNGDTQRSANVSGSVFLLHLDIHSSPSSMAASSRRTVITHCADASTSESPVVTVKARKRSTQLPDGLVELLGRSRKGVAPVGRIDQVRQGSRFVSSCEASVPNPGAGLNGTAREGAVPLDLRRSALLGDGAGDDRLSDIGGVGDLDPAGLGLLGDGDGQGEHTVFVGGADVVTVEAFPEEQLAAEVALGPLGDLDLVALRPHPAARRPHGEEILLHGQLDEAAIHPGKVEVDRELVAPTVGVDRDLAWLVVR